MLNRIRSLSIISMIQGTVLIVFLFSSAVFLINYYQTISHQIRTEVEHGLTSKVAEINHNIVRIGEQALAMSALVSKQNIVKDAYRQYYAGISREQATQALEAYFTKAKPDLDSMLATPVKIHFHLPPARSFLRIWNGTGGDDLSSFRNTVVQISRDKRPIAGVEVGRGGFVIRGIAPIWGDQGQYYGSVETLMPMEKLVEFSKVRQNEELAIYLNQSELNVASDFQKQLQANPSISQKSKGGFIFNTETSTHYKYDYLTSNILLKGSQGNYLFDRDWIYFAVFPIHDFSGGQIGVGVYQLDASASRSILKRSMVNMGIFFLVMTLIVIIFTVLLAKIVVAPINRIVAILQDIASGEGDLTCRLDITSDDEMGKLSKGFNSFVDQIQAIVTRTQSSAETVALASNQIAVAADQLAAGAEEQQAQLSEVATSIEEMSAMIIETSSHTGATEQNTAAVNAAIGEGNQLVGKTAAAIETVVSVIEKARQQVQNLQAKSNEIGSVVQIIDDIADQTNLLALNANIEAARAGDAGRGFAVVADEVRKLAEKTVAATQTISDRIKEIQQDVQTSVQAMNEIVEFSRDGHEAAEESGQALIRIQTAITEVNGAISQIATATVQQSVGVEEISKNIESVATVSKESATSAHGLAAASESLSHEALALKTEVDQFKVG